MEKNFWLERWQNNEIGFHLSEANPMLVKYFEKLELKKVSRLFLPLCGKTRDLAWLIKNGYQVVGSELSELAITQLFDEMNLNPKITDLGSIKKFSAPEIDIFVGDIFSLSPEVLGKVDAIYDRAALIALAPEVRKAYALHLIYLSQKASQLLITFEYDQSLFSGPPFSVMELEVNTLYQNYKYRQKLQEREVTGGIRGLGPATEKVWLLKN